jgi:hypothetical protein
MLTNSKDLNDPNELYRYLDVNKDLVTGFSALFYRFEYALKRAGYCQKCKNAKPDWEKFAQDCDKQLNTQKNPELKTAAQYLLSHPPKKQIQENNKLEWQPVKKEGTQLEQILRLVKTVRNNLFHGGKFPSGPVKDTGRDAKLLESCIIILRECLSLDKNVQRHFWEKD